MLRFAVMVVLADGCCFYIVKRQVWSNAGIAVDRRIRSSSSRFGVRHCDVRTSSSGPVVRRGWFAIPVGVPYWAISKHGMLVFGRPGLAVGADVLLLRCSKRRSCLIGVAGAALVSCLLGMVHRLRALQKGLVLGAGRVNEGHLVNALALRGDEGRGTLRKVRGRREHPLIPESPNGATHLF